MARGFVAAGSVPAPGEGREVSLVQVAARDAVMAPIDDDRHRAIRPALLPAVARRIGRVGLRLLYRSAIGVKR